MEAKESFFKRLLTQAEFSNIIQQDIWPGATSLFFGVSGEDLAIEDEEQQEDEEEDQE